MVTNPFEQLLLDNLKELRTSIDGLRDQQDETKERLTGVETAVNNMKAEMPNFRDEVKKEARRWGAVGGVGATVCGFGIAVVKTLFTIKS